MVIDQRRNGKKEVFSQAKYIGLSVPDELPPKVEDRTDMERGSANAPTLPRGLSRGNHASSRLADCE